MRNISYFWQYYEEPMLPVVHECTKEKTQTRMREEPDQRQFGIMAGTITKTMTREEPDQDPHNMEYHVIPYATAVGTKTLTEAREEPDQDESSSSYRAF